MGIQVVHQLLATKLFQVISLSNSKHTLVLPVDHNLSDATALLALLPSSSAPLSSSIPGQVTYSSANTADLIKTLSALAKSSNMSTILIDCTSDLAVTELYPLAINSGLSVVTPNKKGFSSAHSLWSDILAAQSSGPSAGLVYLEATVGAGLPIISTLRDLVKTGDEVIKIEGVLSGTLSYIFNEFSKPGGSGVEGGKKFSEIVKIAKASGYTVGDHVLNPLGCSRCHYFSATLASSLLMHLYLCCRNPTPLTISLDQTSLENLPSYPDWFPSFLLLLSLHFPP